MTESRLFNCSTEGASGLINFATFSDSTFAKADFVHSYVQGRPR
jgi:hypothetical protein